MHLPPPEKGEAPSLHGTEAGWLSGGGEMGALMRATDWSRTRLGPIDTWPSSLKTMLGVVLGSRFPMLLWWGPDLLHLYNDAYRPILRDKHPASLAAPAAEVWAEVWDVAGPMARSVQDGGPATWTEDLQLFIKSGTMAEETYFTFSYSPVPGDDGSVGGLLNTVQETTAKVQGERQIRMLRDLAAHAAGLETEAAAFRHIAEVLSANALDIPFVSIYVLNGNGHGADLVGEAGWGDYEGPAKAACLSFLNGSPATSWPLAEALRSGRDIVVEDLSERFGPLPQGRWNARPERAILLPLTRAGGTEPSILLVAGLSPHRAFDERYRLFFQATADQVIGVLANASAYEAEKKRAEALAEIDRTKTAFFSNVSHEFRTPLTLILGPLEDELAERADPLPEARRQRLDTVHRNSLRLLKLVNTLLDFSRIEAGRVEASFEPMDLGKETAELASAFCSAAEKAGLDLAIDCPALPSPIYADREMWEKIVLNLLSNALKHTFAGGVRVALRGTQEGAELTVADTGVGIPPEELPRLFERFHRVKGARSRSHEGTGIGLALVQELVRLHGGTVSVASQEGQGTVFTLRLRSGKDHLPSDRIAKGPASAPSPARGAAFVEEALQWSAEGAEVPAPPKAPLPAGEARARILLADDNADMRDYLRRLLADRYEVLAVSDGLAALASIQEARPDLVLTDVMMPGLDGFGLLKALREGESTRTLPVILLSARAGEEAAVEGLEAGADDYLVKPFSARELSARVRTHLELAKIRRAWALELERANGELDAFSYSVSHDLRAPLRAIDGFTHALQEEYGPRLDEKGHRYLQRVRTGVRRMAGLIDDLLGLAQVSRRPLRREALDLSTLAEEVAADLRRRAPERRVRVDIAPGLKAAGDARLLAIVLENLLNNAWKFTSRTDVACISFGLERSGAESVYCVRDNGAGFDMAYASKLFAPFQRLHLDSDFEGTGIGLATVQRIIARHGGRIWAEGVANQGAAFFFTLGESP